MISTTLTERHQNWWDKAPKFKQHTIHAPDMDSLCATIFSDYINRNKYCSSTHFTFDDPKVEEQYRMWISDVGNYARAGGDMW